MCFIMSQGLRKARQDRGLPPFIAARQRKRIVGGRSELQSEQNDNFVATGFDHPQLQVITRRSEMELMFWGLIPDYVKTRQHAKELWESQSTLIARVETMFELKSYKEASVGGRCIVPLTGYFEHHHRNGKKVPFFIHHAEGKVFFLGAISNSWTSSESGKTVKTFAVVTTPANELAARIHNNPRRNESRMPLVLDERDAKKWLYGTDEAAAALIRPNTTTPLSAYPVGPLTGKDFVGNCEQALQQKFHGDLCSFFWK
jgi:putative SOS response-associated peptidase YedK